MFTAALNHGHGRARAGTRADHGRLWSTIAVEIDVTMVDWPWPWSWPWPNRCRIVAKPWPAMVVVVVVVEVVALFSSAGDPVDRMIGGPVHQGGHIMQGLVYPMGAGIMTGAGLGRGPVLKK